MNGWMWKPSRGGRRVKRENTWMGKMNGWGDEWTGKTSGQGGPVDGSTMITTFSSLVVNNQQSRRSLFKLV